MPTLFDPTVINGMELKNRIVRSATYEGMATPDGLPTEEMKRLYERLARGGTGLIVTGYAFINKEGKGTPLQSSVDTDTIIPEWRKITDSVHETDAKIAMQIAHGGRQSPTKSSLKMIYSDQSLLENLPDHPLAPSGIPNFTFMTRPRKMTEEDIWQTIRDFGEAARRVKEAGFDAVQIHAAHGYLINCFLSPLYNRRCDEWGGDADRRFHFLAEVYSAVRQAVGPDFPVLCKLNMDDCYPFGLKPRDSYPAARRLAEMGLDALEISGGTLCDIPLCSSRGSSPAGIMAREANIFLSTIFRIIYGVQAQLYKFHEAYFLPHAKELKPTIDIPLMLVGGFRSYDVAEQVIQDELTDFVSMCRPLIREPGLPNRWLSGNREPAQCTSCNACLGEIGVGNKVKCYNKNIRKQIKD